MKRQSLTAKKARKLFIYNEETGELFYRKNQKKAGHYSKDGYLRITVDYIQYKAHRIIWLIKTGKWPKCFIDHKDGDGINNRWNNLREASFSQNVWNRSKNYNVRLKGITFYWDHKKFAARIRENGKQKHLGFFDCPAAAHFAYIIEANKIFGDFAKYN